MPMNDRSVYTTMIIPSVPSKSRSFGSLSQSSILIGAHLHTNTLQDLFNSHIPIPVSHGRQFLSFDGSRSRVNARHVDFGHKSNLRRDGRILFGAMNTKLIKSTIMLGLMKYNEGFCTQRIRCGTKRKLYR
jgi:hypothetical protein